MRNILVKELPPLELGRVAAQNAKGVIIQKVREADKLKQYEEYKDKVGEIAVGIVKRVEFGNYIVDLGKSEAIIKREELILEKHLKMEIGLELISTKSKMMLRHIKFFYLEHTLNF